MIVLDTHAWIWWAADAKRLPPAARHAIDPRKVFESLQAATDDIVAYARNVEAYLDGLAGC